MLFLAILYFKSENRHIFALYNCDMLCGETSSVILKT